MEERRKLLKIQCANLPREGRVVDLEIGCGHGHFLTRYAETHPQRFCLGIDISRDRIERAERKRRRAGVEHLVFLQCEARDLLDSLPEGVAFSRIFVLFPDPWPKRKHHKNRLVREAFLANLARVSTASAILYLRTDHRGYSEQMDRLIDRSPWWVKAQDVSWPPIEETVFQARAASYFSLSAVRGNF